MTNDTLRALYVLAADYHSGFGSRGYRFMCHVTRLLNKRNDGVGCKVDHRHNPSNDCWDYIRELPSYARYQAMAERYF